jgi:hypothetical protein
VKVSKKYYNILFGTSVSFFMSLVLTLMNAGFSSSFWQRWASGFAVGFFVSLPISLTVIPFIRKVMDVLTAD